MVDPNVAVFVSIIWIFLMVAAGLPIYATLLSAGLIGLTLIEGFGLALAQLKSMPYVHTAEFTLVVVPMFILMGHLAFSAGLSRDAYQIGRKWFSNFPAGLGLATILGCAAFAAACGSSVATAATVGRVAIPEMNELGYDKKISAGTVAAGGTLGILIPPSIILVFYGTITETSVGACLIAGILPGIFSVSVFMIGLMLLGWMDPSLVPAPEKYTWKERIRSLKGFWGIGILFTIVMGGIYGGIATVSETAALGAVAAFIMMLIANKGKIGAIKEKLQEALSETLLTVAMIFLVLIGSYVYSYFITLCGVPEALDQWVAGLKVAPSLIIICFLLFLMVLGCFLDPFSILVITLPIMHPVIVDTLGYNSLWLAVIATILIEVGCITPPVGLNVYVIAGIAPEVPMEDIFAGTGWFVLFQIVVVAILLIFPEIATWLPSTMASLGK